MIIFDVTSVEESRRLRKNYNTFLGSNKKYCSYTWNNFKQYRMPCKRFFSIFKSERATFDDITKLFLNHPYMTLDNQQRTQRTQPRYQKTAMPLGKSIPLTKYQTAYKVVAKKYLNWMTIDPPNYHYNVINKKINMKQLSGLTYNTNDSELSFPLLDNKVKEMLNRFTPKICQGDVVSKNT